jgi:hypothetical protein
LQVPLVVLHIGTEEENTTRGILSATSYMIDCTEKEQQQVQICRWTVQMQEDTVLPADPYLHTVEERTIIKDHKN